MLGLSIFHLSDMINIFMDTKITDYEKMIESEEKKQNSNGDQLFKSAKNDFVHWLFHHSMHYIYSLFCILFS